MVIRGGTSLGSGAAASAAGVSAVASSLTFAGVGSGVCGGITGGGLCVRLAVGESTSGCGSVSSKAAKLGLVLSGVVSDSGSSATMVVVLSCVSPAVRSSSMCIPIFYGCSEHRDYGLLFIYRNRARLGLRNKK